MDIERRLNKNQLLFTAAEDTEVKHPVKTCYESSNTIHGHWSTFYGSKLGWPDISVKSHIRLGFFFLKKRDLLTPGKEVMKASIAL